MKVLAALALTAAAAGFAPAAMAAERCNAATEAVWADAGIKVEAFASGASCEKSVGVIVLRTEDGEPVFWQAYPAAQNAALAGQATPAAMEIALKAWIDPSSDLFKTTADLPEWKADADSPMSGEFPFYVDEGIDRENYARIRALKAPIFCFVSGIESTTCLYQDKDSGGLIFTVGAQSFPG